MTHCRRPTPAQAAAHPVAWAMYASEGRWLPARHLIVLAEYLLKLWRGEILRLAVSFPPRHGKSELISKHFVTWWLGTRPTDRIVLSSYGRDLTTQWTRDARDMFAEFAPEVFGLDTWTRSSVNNWHAFSEGKRVGGEVFGIGRGGGLTGRGADLLVIDDPVRDAVEANSETTRRSIMDWIKAVALTRLSPGGRAVLIQTRWHHEDPIGQIIAQQEQGDGGEEWTYLNFPAICEDAEDPLGRAPGEPLWPERFDVEALAKIRKDVGSYVWSALYQGRPTPAEGGLFKKDWFRYYTVSGDTVTTEGQPPVPIKSLKRFSTVDLAVSTKTSADYTVVATWGICTETRRLFLLDLVRDRIEGPDIVPLLQKIQAEHRPKTFHLEQGGFQLSISQEARRAGLPIRALKPDKDKVSRAMPATAALEGGLVYFPVHAPWLSVFETELLSFPHANHEDMVDCLAYAVLWFQDVLAHLKSRRPDPYGPRLRLAGY